VEKKKQIFELNARLKDEFNKYCASRALAQEQVLEALVFMLVIKDGLKQGARDQLLKEVEKWKEQKAVQGK
jgi:hypothetical protein